MPDYPEVLEAIRAVRAYVHWKPDSASRHLEKRKRRGHLPPTATIDDYELIIRTVLQDKAAQVYRYWYNRLPYVAVVAMVQTNRWLIMFSYDGVLESAFVVEHPERYLNKPGFEWIGSLGELDNEQ